MEQAVEDRRVRGRPGRARDRRRYPRIRMGLEGFYSSPERMLMLRGGNLTLRGAYLSTWVPDLPRTQGTLRLLLPGILPLVKVVARVVWSNSDAESGPLGLGVRFENVPRWKLKRIAHSLLQTAGMQAFPTV